MPVQVLADSDPVHAAMLDKIGELAIIAAQNREFITDLRIHQNAESVSMDHLSSEISRLSTTVGELRDAMNRGRGALWGISTLAAGAGGLVSYIGHRIFGVG